MMLCSPVLPWRSGKSCQMWEKGLSRGALLFESIDDSCLFSVIEGGLIKDFLHKGTIKEAPYFMVRRYRVNCGRQKGVCGNGVARQFMELCLFHCRIWCSITSFLWYGKIQGLRVKRRCYLCKGCICFLLCSLMDLYIHFDSSDFWMAL